MRDAHVSETIDVSRPAGSELTVARMIVAWMGLPALRCCFRC